MRPEEYLSGHEYGTECFLGQPKDCLGLEEPIFIFRLDPDG